MYGGHRLRRMGPLIPILVVLSVLTTFSRAEITHCPTSADAYGAYECAKLPDGRQMELYLTLKSWQDSRAFCIARGANMDLLTIHYQQENDCILELLKTQSTYPSKYYRRMWIGLTDQETEGDFRWTDGSVLNFTHWDDGEPNNWFSSEHCAELLGPSGSGTWWSSSDEGRWNDMKCSNAFPFACGERYGTVPTDPPSVSPSGSPSASPTLEPTPVPTNEPSSAPTYYPTHQPTPAPSPYPTKNPTPHPSSYPSKYPTQNPTKYPSSHPSPNPTPYPTKMPSEYPTKYPTRNPSPYPTKYPTHSPTKYPSSHPSPNPTPYPTKIPSKYPTKHPTTFPSSYPSKYPTQNPTKYPSSHPTHYPTKIPSGYPTKYPTRNPSLYPSKYPTKNPSAYPTKYPTKTPTTHPSGHPTPYPSKYPTKVPSSYPTKYPSSHPSPYPTKYPTKNPSAHPTKYPTKMPTLKPTTYPSIYPTKYPTKNPSVYPTKYPTKIPTPYPTKYPTKNPSVHPTKYPTKSPSTYPTKYPTKNPSVHPTKYPTKTPSTYPTKYPTKNPSVHPTKYPTKTPSTYPTKYPTKNPSVHPTKYPTKTPSTYPSGYPTRYPSGYPTVYPSGYPTKYPTSYPVGGGGDPILHCPDGSKVRFNGIEGVESLLYQARGIQIYADSFHQAKKKGHSHHHGSWIKSLRVILNDDLAPNSTTEVKISRVEYKNSQRITRKAHRLECNRRSAPSFWTHNQKSDCLSQVDVSISGKNVNYPGTARLTSCGMGEMGCRKVEITVWTTSGGPEGNPHSGSRAYALRVKEGIRIVDGGHKLNIWVALANKFPSKAKQLKYRHLDFRVSEIPEGETIGGLIGRCHKGTTDPE